MFNSNDNKIVDSKQLNVFVIDNITQIKNYFGNKLLDRFTRDIL